MGFGIFFFFPMVLCCAGERLWQVHAMNFSAGFHEVLLGILGVQKPLNWFLDFSQRPSNIVNSSPWGKGGSGVFYSINFLTIASLVLSFGVNLLWEII